MAAKLVAELGEAFTSGQVVVLECRDSEDAPVYLLCALREQIGDGATMMPVAELCSIERLSTLKMGDAVIRLGLAASVNE